MWRNPVSAGTCWHKVLPILGIEVKPGPMPLVIACPYCSSPRMRIYDDNTFGGHWHYCPNCKAAGDMIKLASVAWKCNLRQAFDRLLAAGIILDPRLCSGMEPEQVYQRYEKYLVSWQTRSAELLKSGAEALARGHVSPGYIIQQMGLSKDQDRPYWRGRMGRFMIGCTRAEASVACMTGVAARDYHQFRGKGWGPLVGIPFHDLPGRSTGWLFAGRQARPAQDYEFILACGTKAQSRRTVDIGVCMYDVMDSPTAYREQFGNKIFVFNDPTQALKLQSRHMHDSELPLPLVSTYNVKLATGDLELVTEHLWRTRPDKEFIFWSAAVRPDVFNNAARADGRVHICKTLLVTSRHSPHLWLELLQRNARPWAEALEHELLAMDQNTACEFVSQLSLPAEQMQRFLNTCDDNLRQLLESNQTAAHPLRTVAIGKARVIETPAGWLSEKTGEMISNVIIRIDKIVSQEDDDETYYVGRLIMDGQEAPFTLPYAPLLYKTLGVKVHNLAVKLFGKAPIIKSGWTRQLIDLAQQFSTPTVVREDGRFGWKQADLRFAFPQFSVHIDGTVVVEQSHVVDDYAPGQELQPPDHPPPDVIKLGRECLQNEVYWALMACIGANVLAPALGLPRANIGVTGRNDTGIAQTTSRKAGCATMDIRSTVMQPQVFAGRLDAAARRHNYPLMVRPLVQAFSRRAIDRWLNSSCVSGNIINLPPPLELLVPVLGPWWFVNIPAKIDLSLEAQQFGDRIMPLWLQRICRRKLELESNSDSFILQVLDDMAAMMGQYGANADNIRAASKHIDDATDDAAGRFVKLLFTAIEDGIVFTGRRDVLYKRRACIVQIDDQAAEHNGIFVPDAALTQIVNAYDLFIPSPGVITDALTAANALDCRCAYNDHNGWLIIDRWWHQQISRCRAGLKRLTVIGGA